MKTAKLTMVTIWFRNFRITDFVNIIPSEDSKVRLHSDTKAAILAKHGLYPRRGETISVG